MNYRTQYESGFRDAYELLGIDLSALKTSERYRKGYVSGHGAAIADYLDRQKRKTIRTLRLS